VVVANFLNTTGDTTFDRTLDRALEIDLSQSPCMDVMSDGEVVSILQYMGRLRDSALTADIARQICERSNRLAVLNGTIASVGRKYSLTLRATNCNSGGSCHQPKLRLLQKRRFCPRWTLWRTACAQKLGESSRSVESYKVPIITATTPSLEALQAYSMGD
jgi:hypothetical protein